MPLKESNGWYEHQQRSDAKARRASEDLLGPERDAFIDAMGLMARCLDLVGNTSPVHDLATKRMISLANHAFNLLWSAWDSALAGRYDAATSHWRSIEDSYDHLLAIHANPRLAHQIAQRKIDVHEARRAVRDMMERQKPGEGKKWLEARAQAAKRIQPYSHVSLEATNSGLAVRVTGGRKVAVMRPGGKVAQMTLRLNAVCLASSANELLMAFITVFADIEGVGDLWHDVGLDLCETHLETVARELNNFSVPPGEVESVYLYKSGDEALEIEPANA